MSDPFSSLASFARPTKPTLNSKNPNALNQPMGVRLHQQQQSQQQPNVANNWDLDFLATKTINHHSSSTNHYITSSNIIMSPSIQSSGTTTPILNPTSIGSVGTASVLMAKASKSSTTSVLDGIGIKQQPSPNPILSLGVATPGVPTNSILQPSFSLSQGDSMSHSSSINDMVGYTNYTSNNNQYSPAGKIDIIPLALDHLPIKSNAVNGTTKTLRTGVSSFPASILKKDDFFGLGTSLQFQPSQKPHGILGLGSTTSQDTEDLLGFGIPLSSKSVAALPDDDHPLGILGLPIQESIARKSERPDGLSASLTPLSSMNDPPEVNTILEMGFSRDNALQALESSNYDLTTAIAMLVSKQNSTGQEPANSSAHSRRVSFDKGDRVYMEKLRDDESNGKDKFLNAATSVGMTMFSNAKSAFQFSKQKIASLAATVSERPERPPMTGNSQPKARYRDNDSSDSSDSEEDEAARRKFTDEPKCFAPRKVQVPSRSHPPPSKKQSHIAILSESTISAASTLPLLEMSSRQESQLSSHKSLGNSSYKSGDYAASEIHYTTAIQTLTNIQNDLSNYTHPIISALYLNRAQTRLKTGDFKGCVNDCRFIIEGCERGGYGAAELKKALTRRAEALEGMEKFAEALEDYRKLGELGVIGGGGMGRCLKGLEGIAAANSSTIASQEITFDPFDTGMSTPPVRTSGPLRKTENIPALKNDDPCVIEAVSKAVNALRMQNQANDDLESLKLGLKDSTDAKIHTWRHGKEGNLRALLSSLETILWPELFWIKIGLGELLQPGQVKIRYMRAVAKLHPDKLAKETGVQEMMIAAAVFSTLNDAWEAFKTQN